MEEIIRKIDKLAAERISRTLATMTDKNIGIEISYLQARKLSDIKPSFTSEEEVVAFIYMPIHGDIKGSSALIFPERDSLIMSDLLQKRELGTAKTLNDMDINALKETGNVVAGNFLTIISNTLKVKLIEGQPKFMRDNFAVIFNEFISESTRYLHEMDILAIESLFFFEPITIKGYILFLFEREKMSALLNSSQSTDDSQQ